MHRVDANQNGDKNIIDGMAESKEQEFGGFVVIEHAVFAKDYTRRSTCRWSGKVAAEQRSCIPASAKSWSWATA